MTGGASKDSVVNRYSKAELSSVFSRQIFMSSTTLHIFKSNALTIGELVRLLPEGTLRNIVVKPNWVIHASHSDFPIEALVTNSHLIGLVVDACFEKYPGLESLIVGDVPLQSCEFGRMCEQSGIDLLAASCHSK